MKGLTSIQYNWLCAVERGNYIDAVYIATHFTEYGVLYNRGYYTFDPHPDNPNTYVYDSVRLTSIGRTALMCHRAVAMLTLEHI